MRIRAGLVGAAVALLAAAILAAGAPAGESPAAPTAVGWRGDGSGRYACDAPPTEWARDKNVVWSTEVGKCHSSPIVVAGKVFLQAEPETLLCLDRSSGKVLWKATNAVADLPADLKAEPKNKIIGGWGTAIQTPASDGRLVFAVFATGVVAAYDLEGARRWVRWFDLPLLNQYGRAASPVLVAGRLLVHVNRLIALKPETGETVWEADAKPAYGTPAAARIEDTDLVITPRGDAVRVSDGKILARGLGATSYPSPLVQDGVVYFIDAKATAVRLPAKAADELKPERLWTQELDGEFFASPVLAGGFLLAVNNDALVYVLDPKTGQAVAQKEIEIPAASGKFGPPSANLYPSLTIAGKYMYLLNDAGHALVLEPGRDLKEVGRARVPEGCGASPVFDGRQLLLRAGKMLYCIGR
jgi:outer membrane protein assembly factor BamB